MPDLSPARAILHELETTAIKQRLKVLPDLLQAARTDEMLARQELDNAKTALATVEARLMADIANAVDDKGKPKYSNAELRAAALTTAKAADKEARSSMEWVRNAQHVLDSVGIRKQTLLDDLSTVKTRGRIVAAELDMLTNLDD